MERHFYLTMLAINCALNLSSFLFDSILVFLILFLVSLVFELCLNASKVQIEMFHMTTLLCHCSHNWLFFNDDSFSHVTLVSCTHAHHSNVWRQKQTQLWNSDLIITHAEKINSILMPHQVLDASSESLFNAHVCTSSSLVPCFDASEHRCNDECKHGHTIGWMNAKRKTCDEHWQINWFTCHIGFLHSCLWFKRVKTSNGHNFETVWSCVNSHDWI